MAIIALSAPKKAPTQSNCAQQKVYDGPTRINYFHVGTVISLNQRVLELR